MCGNQRSQLGIKRGAVPGVDPAAILRLEMEAARTCGDPDFARDAVAIDDDLAAVVELDLDDAVSRRLEIQVGVFQRLLDAGQRRSDGLVEFSLARINFRHDVPC